MPSDKSRGIYRKFEVHRTDGRDAMGQKHHDCEYFVLDLTHDPFALPAVRAYAAACRASGFEKLANDLERHASMHERLHELREQNAKEPSDAGRDDDDGSG